MPATAVVVVALVAGAVETVQAQQRTAGAALGAYLEAFSFATPAAVGAKSVSVLSAPFAVRLPVGPVLSFEANGALARGSITAQDGSTSTLSSFTDTEVRATLAVQREAGSVTLSAIGLVPTGSESLTLAEASVAGLAASDLLGFRVSSWGSGGGGGGELTLTRAIDMGSVGVSAGYRMAASFSPLEALQIKYRPGSELRLRFAFDRTLANDKSLAFQLGYSRYGEDQWQGIGLLRSGQRMLALMSYAAPLGSATATGYGGVLYRSGGALGDVLLRTGLLSGVPAPPSETLVLAGWSARVPWAARIVVPGMDFRLLRRADGTGQGYVGGVGLAAELPAGPSVRFVPSARFRMGKLLVAEGIDSGVTGFEVGLGLRFGGAR